MEAGSRRQSPAEADLWKASETKAEASEAEKATRRRPQTDDSESVRVGREPGADCEAGWGESILRFASSQFSPRRVIATSFTQLFHAMHE